MSHERAMENGSIKSDVEFDEYYLKIASWDELAILADVFHIKAADDDYTNATTEARENFSNGVIDDFEVWEHLQLAREKFVAIEASVHAKRSGSREYNQKYVSIRSDVEQLTKFYSQEHDRNPEIEVLNHLYLMLGRCSLL